MEEAVPLFKKKASLWHLFFVRPVSVVQQDYIRYVGKIGSGLLYFFTVGCFFVGTVVDLLTILSRKFREKYGFYLKQIKGGQMTNFYIFLAKFDDESLFCYSFCQ